MQTDAVVGKILAALDEHGLATNTLVIFTADNGCSPAAGTPALEKQGHFASAQFPRLLLLDSLKLVLIDSSWQVPCQRFCTHNLSS